MKRTLALAIASATLLTAPILAHGAIIAIEFGGTVWEIDETTGEGVRLGNSGFGSTNSMAANSAGILYSAADSQLITIDPNTGAGTLAATLSGFGAEGISIRGLAFSSAGVLYGVNNGGSAGSTTVNDLLYTINPSTGAMTFVGTINFPGVQALDFSPVGTLYGFDIGSSGFGSGLIIIDPLTATAVDVNPAVGGSSSDIQTIVFSPDGTLYGARDNLFTINSALGNLTLVGDGTTAYVDVRGMEFIGGAQVPPVPAPEPSTLPLLGLGLIWLAGSFARRTNGLVRS